MTEAPALGWDGAWLLLSVKGRPGARADRIRGISGGHVQVDVAAAPEDGRATERLLGYLAERFGVPRRDVELVSGAHARWKRVRVRAPARIPAELQEVLAGTVPLP